MPCRAKLMQRPAIRPQLGVFETPPPPVAVRTGKRRKGALAQRPVQIATDKEARQALEKDLFHRIALPLNPPKDLRLERRLLRQRPQSRANENVPANRRRPLLPLRQRLIAAQGPRRTNVFGCSQPCITCNSHTTTSSFSAARAALVVGQSAGWAVAPFIHRQKRWVFVWRSRPCLTP